MSNGTIPEKSKTSGREIASLFLLILGAPMVVGGVGMLWGWGGILLLAGLVLSTLGVLLGISKTGKE